MSIPDLTNQEKLEEIYKLTLENNDILHKLRNRGRLTIALQIIYWLAIAGALGGVYYYVRPIIESVTMNSTRAGSLFQDWRGGIQQMFSPEEALKSIEALEEVPVQQ
jgi:hypothetical protein